LTFYKNSFRTMEYMDWNKTYNEVKEGMKEWKSSKYLPNLKRTGSSIFECSCGIGLNLLLTLEILQDVGHVRDLHLYGTDYSMYAAITSNMLLDSILQEATLVSGGKRGAVCTADSTQLSFIPDNSFDLVFTSHILPIPNPWELDTTTIYNNSQLMERRREICHLKDTDWKSAILYQLAQDRQEELYGRWVNEMIRIAKPGMVIAIEQITDPTFCLNDTNAISNISWSGGVSQSFWRNGIERYNWNIDPTSIEIETDTLFPNQHHYHVMMKKR
jgi:hypothetical protein